MAAFFGALALVGALFVCGQKYLPKELLTMKKIISLLAISSMLIAMTACSSEKKEESSKSETQSIINQSDYDKLKSDNTKLQNDYNDLKKEYDNLKDSYSKLLEEPSKEAPTEPATEATEPNNIDNVIWDSDYVKITYMGAESSSSRTDIKLLIENKSDTNLTVQARDESINGIMVNPIFSCDVVSGKKANSKMSFFKLKEEGIDKLETLEFNFHIFTQSGWETVEDTDTITINFE